MHTAVVEKPPTQLTPSDFFQVFNGLEAFERDTRLLIPTLEDEQLVQGIQAAEALGDTAWRIRAAFAEEIATRAKRLNGGRGHKDTTGQGVTKALVRVAAEAGVELRTIQRDRQILSTFGETCAISDRRLSRAYFEIALAAPEPTKAIEVARDKLDEDPNYNARQFSAYVRSLQEEPDASKHVELEKPFYLEGVPITQEARRALVGLCKRRNLKPGEVISQALIDAEEWAGK
ncbi:MAG TPA: hypothetical protein VJS44_04725 [Pyrinomonadaceae bacterium]|nr:hypothetical protein [Pyrinomonadaceae bacterium]